VTRCPSCGRLIQRGQLIERHRDKWMHRECAWDEQGQEILQNVVYREWNKRKAEQYLRDPVVAKGIDYDPEVGD